MPRAAIEGDRVLITGYRDFAYRQWNDFDPNYYEREVFLSHLTSVDFYVSYWQEGPIAHTFLSFNFDNAAPVCISIEIRPEVGEGFAPVASMFKQYELIYVVGDERDLVRSRTNFRFEDVYLYRIQAQPEAMRELFMIYMKRINELSDSPEWYHLLKSNCTLNIIRYKKNAMESASTRFDYRHLINGWVDRYLYEAGYLDTSMPFEELRKKSLINQSAKGTDNDISARDFSRRIRESLPGMDPPLSSNTAYPTLPVKKIPSSLTTLLPTRPPRPGLKIEKGLLVTGTGEKVVQIPIDLTPVRFMPGNDRFAHTLESFKVGPGIPITESMISNHRNPGFEELG